jgi:hypothetical protein
MQRPTFGWCRVGPTHDFGRVCRQAAMSVGEESGETSELQVGAPSGMASAQAGTSSHPVSRRDVNELAPSNRPDSGGPAGLGRALFAANEPTILRARILQRIGATRTTAGHGRQPSKARVGNFISRAVPARQANEKHCVDARLVVCSEGGSRLATNKRVARSKRKVCRSAIRKTACRQRQAVQMVDGQCVVRCQGWHGAHARGRQGLRAVHVAPERANARSIVRLARARSLGERRGGHGRSDAVRLPARGKLRRV